MWCFPFPEAKESATSKSDFKCGRILDSISDLNVSKSAEEFTSTIFTFGFVKGFFVEESFTIIIDSTYTHIFSCTLCS